MRANFLEVISDIWMFSWLLEIDDGDGDDDGDDDDTDVGDENKK